MAELGHDRLHQEGKGCPELITRASSWELLGLLYTS
jgi:hypothetical protein